MVNLKDNYCFNVMKRTKEMYEKIISAHEDKKESVIETHGWDSPEVHEWYKKLTVNEDIVDIAKQLRTQNFNIYVLSNMAEATYLYIKNIDFFKLCDGIVISAYENIKKPDKKIFEILLNRFNIKANESLFIDDDDTNRSYITANELGILGRRVEPNSAKDIIKLLNEFDIKLL